MEEVHKQELLTAIRFHLNQVIELCLEENVLPEIKVHEIRKSFKRLNALLKLFPAELQAEVILFRKPMRSIARQLTSGRESTVNLQLFERLLLETQGLDEPKNEMLKEKLTQAKEESLLELIEKEKILDDILQLMNSGLKNLLPVLTETNYAVHIFDDILDTFFKSRHLYKPLTFNYNAELYHELRKRMKTLWYQSELEAPGQTEVPGTILEQLHTITDQLGDDHDWYIFLSDLKQEKYGLSDEGFNRLKSEVQQIQDATLKMLNQNLSEFFRLSEEQYLELLRRL